MHRAITACTSIAEVYQSNRDGEEIILTVYPDALALNTTLLIYFDEEFVPCKESASSYRAVLEQDKNKHTAVISFYSQEKAELIYSLSVSSYAPQTLDELEGGGLQ